MSFIPGGISVVLVDVNQIFVQAMEPLLSNLEGISVLGQGTDGNDAVFLCRVYQPHVLVIGDDPDGPPLGLTIAMVHQYSPSTRVLVMAANSIHGVDGLETGADAWGFVSKEGPLSELIDSIRSAAHEVWRRPANPKVPATPSKAGGGPLSRRELQVLELIADGKSNAAIAQDLTISGGTVKRHVANLYAKLGVSSRVSAYGRGVAMGLLHSPSAPIKPNWPRSSVAGDHLLNNVGEQV